ncbi:MAG: hypothetical protein AAF612_02560 [Planctomycetota bacterium]
MQRRVTHAPGFRGCLVWVCAWVLAWAGAAGAYAQPVEEQVRRLDSLIRSADADLSAAESSAGTAANPARGSRLRLTLMRVESAEGKLAQAREALAGIAEDAPGLEASVESLTAAQAKATAIRRIVNPPAPSEPEPAPEAPATPPGGDAPATPPAEGEAPGGPAVPAVEEPAPPPPLTAEQRKVKGEMSWSARQAKYWADQAKGRLDGIEQAGDPVQYPALIAAREALLQSQAEMQKVVDGYQQAPAGHPEMADVDRDAQAAATLMQSNLERYNTLGAPLHAAGELMQSPELPADIEKVDSFVDRYRDFQNNTDQMPGYTQTMLEDEAVMAEVGKIAQTYAVLLRHGTPNGVKLSRAIRSFGNRRDAFLQGAQQFAAGAPGAIDGDLASVQELAATGAAEKKPAFFGPHGGIEQRLGWAEARVALLESIDAEAGAAARAKLDAARVSVKEQAATLRETIIAGNTLPADRFREPDRDAVIAKAQEVLLAQHPGLEVLAVHIPMEKWKRVTEWRHSNGAFYKVDRSELQAQFVVKHDDTLAAVRPVNVSKNHMQGDTLWAGCFDGPDDEIPARRLIPLEKVGG